MLRSVIQTRWSLCATVVIVATAIGTAQQTSISLFGPGRISGPDTYESFGSLSSDGTEFYYTSHKPDFSQHKIVVSRFANGNWSAPEVLGFSGTWNDREPRLSPNGLRLYFSSTRPADPSRPPGRLDLFTVERDPATRQWSTPRRLEGSINSDVHDFCPVVTANGTLYFVSARSGGIRGPGPTDLYNVWRARPIDSSGLRFREPENLGPAINTGLETNVYVTPDERVMLVSRDGAPDSLGGDDLYVSTVVNGAWGPLRHLPAPINTDKYEYGPSLSPDGRWFFFTSARGGTADIYRASISILQLDSRK